MPSTKRQYVIVVLFILLIAFTLWSYNWISLLLFTSVLGIFYHTQTYSRIKKFWRKQSSKTKNILEWLVAVVLGVMLISLLNTYFYSVYKVRSTSMLISYKTGELVLVDKFKAGSPANINNPDRFRRLQGTGSIKRCDVIVFHFPEGDSILKNRKNDSYYYLKRQYKDKPFLKKEEFDNISYRPVKLRTKYIKRVVGLPGDTVLFREGTGIINGKKIPPLPSVIQKYTIRDNTPYGKRQVILNYSRNQYSKDDKVVVELSYSDIEKNMFADLITREVLPLNLPDPNIFPFSPAYFWNKDNFGPVVIPRKGVTVKLTPENLPLYFRIITAYEKNKLKVDNSTIYINGKPSKEYTFKMDYYWVMGDNRSHSFDSRYWGFVPDNHIIGIVEKKMFGNM